MWWSKRFALPLLALHPRDVFEETFFFLLFLLFFLFSFLIFIKHPTFQNIQPTCMYEWAAVPIVSRSARACGAAWAGWVHGEWGVGSGEWRFPTLSGSSLSLVSGEPARGYEPRGREMVGASFPCGPDAFEIHQRYWNGLTGLARALCMSPRPRGILPKWAGRMLFAMLGSWMLSRQRPRPNLLFNCHRVSSTGTMRICRPTWT